MAERKRERYTVEAASAGCLDRARRIEAATLPAALEAAHWMRVATGVPAAVIIDERRRGLRLVLAG